MSTKLTPVAAAERPRPSVAFVVDDLVWWIDAGLQPTGIQRVMTELLNTAAKRHDIHVWPAMTVTRLGLVRLVPVDPVRLRWGASATPAPPVRGKARAKSLVKSFAKRVIPMRARQALREAAALVDERIHQPAPVDAVVVAGAFWTGPTADRLGKLSRRVPAIRVLVYDLIPLTCPQWFDARAAEPLEHGLLTMLPLADRVVTLSEQAASELAEHFPVSKGRVVVAVPTLAAHVPRQPAGTQPVRAPFLLAVGTVEPRKNYALVVDAWRQARSDPRLAGAQLVICGRPLATPDPVEASIADDAGIVRIRAATDTELEALYRDCAATVHASFVEGFGLPVRESVARGIPTLASSAIPRDGLPQDSVVSFDPTDAAALAALMVDALVTPTRRAPYSAAGETGWEPVLAALTD